MKCYYSVRNNGTEEWIKGYITTFSGREVVLEAEDRDQSKMISMWNPEILFYGEQVAITGYFKVPDSSDDKLYRMKSVSVKFSKPREKQ